MFCNQCGAEIDPKAKFCNKCGAKLEPTMGSIIFARENQFYGVLVPIKVFLDGKEVASISAGNEAKVETTVGTHKVAFNLWSGNNITDIEITPENPNIKVLFKLGMGALTSKPKIVSITNL